MHARARIPLLFAISIPRLNLSHGGMQRSAAAARRRRVLYCTAGQTDGSHVSAWDGDGASRGMVGVSIEPMRVRVRLSLLLLLLLLRWP